MQRRLRTKSGFTLIETLVAFAILAMAMAQLLVAIGGGARNDGRADFLLRASRLGRSQLDALGAEGQIGQGESSGRYDDGLYWRLSVSAGRVMKSPQQNGSVASYWARLTVSRPTPQGAPTESLTLTTLKIVTQRETGQ